MNKKNLIGRRILLAAVLAMILPCMASCSSREAVLLENDDLVLEDSRSGEDSVTGESDAEAMGKEPAPALQESIQSPEAGSPQQVEQSTLFVHICGEVESPGVYELPAGSRIYEAVEEAGGFTAYAEESHVNLAQILEDGCKIKIPAVGEEISEDENFLLYTGTASDTAAGEEDGLVDINRADKQQLCTLPGVGESRAESIISYREESGGFKTIEDIMKVDGIKEGMFARMKDKICVRGGK